MDFLKAEIATKRKALDDDGPARPSKYVRRGDLEKMRLEEERKKAEAEREAAKPKAAPKQEANASPAPEAGTPKPDGYNISNEEAIRRLRAKGQPIRLFGESDKERRLRLRALELIEEKDGERESNQHDFKKALEEVERGKEKAASDKSGGKPSDEAMEVLDLGLLKTDPNKLYPLIYFALKRLLKEWEAALDERPEQIKESSQGKVAAATQVQSAQYLKPFFKLLRSRNLPDDMLMRISEIVHHVQKRQYQKANDSYLRLSIGNAAWPIGVTMVGIHERSAREKISTDQIAHVLNDEVSRKYIQSLKRLITFAQTRHPPEDVSQLMG